MGLPRTVTRTTKNGVKFTSNVDRANYTLGELTRAALRDIGKFLTRRMHQKIRGIASKSLTRSPRVRNAFQYWNRRRETDLIVGIKHDTWYGVDQELGTDGQPKRDILRSTVIENINIIEQIQAQYLEHIENEMNARRLIDENAEVSNDDKDVGDS
jgi:hypothetical protein